MCLFEGSISKRGVVTQFPYNIQSISMNKLSIQAHKHYSISVIHIRNERSYIWFYRLREVQYCGLVRRQYPDSGNACMHVIRRKLLLFLLYAGYTLFFI